MMRDTANVTRLLQAGVFFLFALSFAGCSGRDTPQVVSSGLTLAEVLELLPPLPRADAPRLASTPFAISLSGAETAARGDNCDESGSNLYLRPPSGETAWAMYTLDTGGLEVLSVVVNLSLSDCSAYVAQPDYGRTVWRIFEQDTYGEVEVPVDEQSISAEDQIHIAVLACDDVEVGINGVALTVDRPGWTIYPVVDTPGIGGGVDLIVVGNKPMMAYRSNTTPQGAVMFARATAELPTIAGQWITMAVEAGEGDVAVGNGLVAAVVNGKPAIAYAAHSLDALSWWIRYARATSAEPEDFTEWNVHTACPPTVGTQVQLGLCECYGAPRIAYCPLTDNHRAYIACSAVPASEPGDWDYYPVTAEEQRAYWPALTTIDNLPVLAMKTEELMHLGYAQVPTPTGPPSWSTMPAEIMANTGSLLSIAVQQIGEDQRPVVSYIDGDFVGGIRVARPTTNTPAGPDDWVRCLIDWLVKATDISVTDNGRPFAAYYNSTDGEICCAIANIVEFENPEDFDVFTLHEDPAMTAAHVSAACIGTVPTVAFWDDSCEQLKFGFYIEE